MLCRRSKQSSFSVVMIEALALKNHLLRKIDAAVDFSFIHDLCKPPYCKDNGRPAVNFRMMRYAGTWDTGGSAAWMSRTRFPIKPR